MKNNNINKLRRTILMVLLLFNIPLQSYAEESESIFQKGITGSAILDYLVLPFLMTIIIFIIFRKKFVAVTKKIEKTKEEKIKKRY